MEEEENEGEVEDVVSALLDVPEEEVPDEGVEDGVDEGVLEGVVDVDWGVLFEDGVVVSCDVGVVDDGVLVGVELAELLTGVVVVVVCVPVLESGVRSLEADIEDVPEWPGGRCSLVKLEAEDAVLFVLLPLLPSSRLANEAMAEAT